MSSEWFDLIYHLYQGCPGSILYFKPALKQGSSLHPPAHVNDGAVFPETAQI